jgi:hypothetical protein
MKINIEESFSEIEYYVQQVKKVNGTLLAQRQRHS